MCSSSRPRFPWSGACATSRNPRLGGNEARRGAPGSMDCPQWREGFALLEQAQTALRSADALVALRCRGRARSRFSRHHHHRQPHGPAGRPQPGRPRRLAQRHGAAGGPGKRHAENLGPRRAGAALGRRSCRGRWCATPSASSVWSGRCLPPTSPSIRSLPHSMRSTTVSSRSRGTCPTRRARKLFHDNAVRIYRSVREGPLEASQWRSHEHARRRHYRPRPDGRGLHQAADRDRLPRRRLRHRAGKGGGRRCARRCRRARSPAEVARAADIVLMSVTTTAAMEQAVLGERRHQPRPAGFEGKVLVDHSTTEIDTTKRVAAALGGRDRHGLRRCAGLGWPRRGRQRHARHHGRRRGGGDRAHQARDGAARAASRTWAPSAPVRRPSSSTRRWCLPTTA